MEVVMERERDGEMGESEEKEITYSIWVQWQGIKALFELKFGQLSGEW